VRGLCQKNVLSSFSTDTHSKQEAETKAIELYKKEKDTWLEPRLVETEDEYEVENEPDRA
jgi:hypothetical protein